jgi:glyoxylase-like metal-dependent hydrolase (beta-lactamase superfamily II)
MPDFPLRLGGGVYYTGFNSPKSYGGQSYVIRHPDGNWLIDSPRYLPHLIRQFDALGGIRFIFLTHRDDVAEAHQYAKRWGSQRIIHRVELSAHPDAECVIEGDTAVEFSPAFSLIPTPGHTRGHCVLLYRNRYLFSGDHVWWSRALRHLGASQEYCWYSRAEQTRSMERLRERTFEWVLPGHGQWIKLPPEVMRREVAELIERMRAAPKRGGEHTCGFRHLSSRAGRSP